MKRESGATVSRNRKSASTANTVHPPRPLCPLTSNLEANDHGPGGAVSQERGGCSRRSLGMLYNELNRFRATHRLGRVYFVFIPCPRRRQGSRIACLFARLRRDAADGAAANGPGAR